MRAPRTTMIRVNPDSAEQGTYCTCFCLPEGGDICADCGKPARPLVNASAPDASQPAVGIGAAQPATHSEPVSPAEPVTMPPPCPRLQIRFGADTVLHIGHSLLLGRGYAGVAPVLYEYLAGLTGISRRHCLIQWDEHGGWLTDLGSTNGTRANGAVLRAGEAMRITVDALPLTVALGHYAYCTIDAQETPQ
jgi:FHA domain